MKPFLILLTAIALHINVSAQQFEWAASGGNLNGGFRSAAMDSKGNTIVTGHSYLAFNFYRGESYLYSSTGDSMEISTSQTPLLIISFDPSGRINWKKEIPGCGEESFVGIDEDQNIIVLGQTGPYGGAYMESNEGGVTIREGRRHFLYILNNDGEPLSVAEDTADMIDDPVSFHIYKKQLIISGNKYVEDDGTGHNSQFDYILKLNEDLTKVWEKRIVFKEGHGSFVPSALTDVAPNGDIYFCTSVYIGASFDGKLLTAPPVKKEHDSDYPYQAYIACYAAGGNLKWVKGSGGKTIFHSIKATNNGAILGGRNTTTNDFFGTKLDTAHAKIMVLASFSVTGNLLWKKTSTADRIVSINTDQQRNIYTVVLSKNCYPYMLYEGDTLRNCFESLVIASYTYDGKFRWVKNCKVPMNDNVMPTLLTDGCGNIYIAGEMWSVLRAKLKWFDAAFVKGDSYGDAPFIAKLKNTLPKVIAEKIAQKKDVCIVSPAPWDLYVYPNPFTTQTTVQYKITYEDKASLLVYDMNGQLVSTVFTNKQTLPGTYTITFRAGSLAKGGYVLMLRGTEAVATERIIIQ